MHFRFVSIHPFGDGNGRMCRILMNYILFKNKYPMFARVLATINPSNSSPIGSCDVIYI